MCCTLYSFVSVISPCTEFEEKPVNTKQLEDLKVRNSIPDLKPVLGKKFNVASEIQVQNREIRRLGDNNDETRIIVVGS